MSRFLEVSPLTIISSLNRVRSDASQARRTTTEDGWWIHIAGLESCESGVPFFFQHTVFLISLDCFSTIIHCNSKNCDLFLML